MHPRISPKPCVDIRRLGDPPPRAFRPRAKLHAKKSQGKRRRQKQRRSALGSCTPDIPEPPPVKWGYRSARSDTRLVGWYRTRGYRGAYSRGTNAAITPTTRCEALGLWYSVWRARGSRADSDTRAKIRQKTRRSEPMPPFYMHYGRVRSWKEFLGGFGQGVSSGILL